jgi:hypothetical protein
LIDVELKYFYDQNPNKIFLGGITNGASIAIATYLRYKRDKPLGGIMSLYGINPIESSLISRSASEDKVKSEIPMLMFNNKYLLNDKDIAITSDWLKKTYYSKDEDNFSSHGSTILGSFVSNMKSNFEYKHSGDWP